MSNPARFTIKTIERRIQNVRLRMPFRFGVATLTDAPMMTMKVEIEGSDGSFATGYSADVLPALWFDKLPAKTIDEKVDDQITMSHIAAEQYFEAGATSTDLFNLWWNCYPQIKKAAADRDINFLTAGFGSSFPERALMDAVCRLARASFFEAVKENLFGIEPAKVHYELGGFQIAAALPEKPLRQIWCRHTIGLGDPLRGADVRPDLRIGDGLPESLEEDIATYGLRYFKIKIDSDREWNLNRLNDIAGVLAARCKNGFRVTLDGNEQVKDLEDVAWLLAKLHESPRTRALRESIIFVEQPLSREKALSTDAQAAVRKLAASCPIIIDESDDDVIALSFARHIGYSGISCKNCKGVFKAILNACLLKKWQAEDSEEENIPSILSSEDLTNTGVIPLQQDCTTIAALGIEHSERNGHHYFRGLSHLSEKERASALKVHADLYGKLDGFPTVRIDGGVMRLGSLQCVGYGYASEIDFESRMTLADWAKQRAAVAV